MCRMTYSNLDLPQLCSECLCWNILKSRKKKFLFHMFILGGAQLALLHCRFSHFVIENKTYLSLVGFGLSNNTQKKGVTQLIWNMLLRLLLMFLLPEPQKPGHVRKFVAGTHVRVSLTLTATSCVHALFGVLSVKKGAFSPEDKSLSVTLTWNTQRRRIVAPQASCHHFVLL